MMVDAGSRSEAGRTYFIPSLTACSTRDPDGRQNCDRFIPNRSAMDLDMARSLLSDPRKDKEITASMSPSAAAYQMLLDEVLMKNSNRILAFKNKPVLRKPTGITDKQDLIFQDVIPNFDGRRRYLPRFSDRSFSAPELVNNYFWNLLDWGSSNIVSIGLRNKVYLWDASNGSMATELMTVPDEDDGPLSICWAPDGCRIAVALLSPELQTLRDGDRFDVVSLDWNGNNILTAGGADGTIINNDMTAKSHIVQTYKRHRRYVYCLKWLDSGQQLASRGLDDLLYIWEQNQSRPVHRIINHTASAKALAWCLFQSNLLVSGGAGNDGCINFWNTKTGTCLNSVNTGSQVGALMWSMHEQELLSVHGILHNQLSLWKYPSMTKLAEQRDLDSQFIFTAQSPNGCRVASAGNEVMQLWTVFPQVQKPAPNRANARFNSYHSYIR